MATIFVTNDPKTGNWAETADAPFVHDDVDF